MGSVIKLLVDGGSMTPGPAVAQQLGPMGINLGQVISQVNEKTKDFKGMQVPVVLDVDPDTKEVAITVLSPPTSGLLKKELGIDKASGARMKFKAGNIAFERVVAVAKQKHEHMLSNDFRATVSSVLGTCQAMGVLVDSKEVSEIMDELREGAFDAIITSQKTYVDPEKDKELKEHFSKIDKAQQLVKAEMAAEAEKKK